jgi:hypothetical protein
MEMGPPACRRRGAGSTRASSEKERPVNHTKRDDFTLWVDTPDGGLAAVVPVAPRFSGDGRTRLLFAASPTAAGDETPIDKLIEPPAATMPESATAGPDDELLRAPRPGPPGATTPRRRPADPTILPADHPLSRKAFALQE